ncbi:MAG: lipopolysaccharide kinase InaA family protein [Candidatus Binataceae bacterium]
MSDAPVAEFDEYEGVRIKLTLHRDFASHATTVVRRIGALRAANAPGIGGRASVHRLELGGGVELIARRSLRGGMMRHLVRDMFVGVQARPLAELRLTLEARRRNIPVAEPAGAVVEWLAPLIYRGWFLTRPIPGMTLWEFMQTDDDPAVRKHVLTAARASIADMHERGLVHADLNLLNLFVTQLGEKFAVVVLDLDKARLLDWPLPQGLRKLQARRLARSVRKLDPTGRYFDANAFSILDID